MKIDEEFASLIPPLTEYEHQRLEASILEEGCRDAIVLWGEIIVDGHNRYGICTKHNVPYKTVQKEFSSRDEVKLWMLKNQLSRRNLNDFQRVEMVRKCEEAIKAQAKARQGSRTDIQEKFPESSQSRDEQSSQSRDELGAMAGVSGKTYEHAVTVLETAPEAVIQATRDKELSINAAYELTKLPEDQQTEAAKRIEQGETPKAVVSELRKAKKVEPVDNDPVEIKDEIVVTQLSEATGSLQYLRSEGKPDFVAFIWLKPKEMVRLFDSDFREFKYHGIAFVWSHKGEIQELCAVGTCGDAEVPKELKPRVIESESMPKILDEIRSQQTQNPVKEILP